MEQIKKRASDEIQSEIYSNKERILQLIEKIEILKEIGSEKH